LRELLARKRALEERRWDEIAWLAWRITAPHLRDAVAFEVFSTR